MNLIKAFLWSQFTVAVLCVFFDTKARLGRETFHRSTGQENKPLRGKSPTHPCGNKLCRCWSYIANCSRVPGGLQYIPPLPATIRYLYFSYNDLKSVPASFFQNVTKLTKVDISSNSLTYISPEAFRPLENLKDLFLSNNTNLTYLSLAPAFQIPSLEELDIMSCALGPIPRDLFHNATLPRLKSLRMHDNDVGNLALSTFKPLVALQELGLPTNSISKLHADSVIGIEKINLDSNYIYDFPTTCNGTTSFYPHLRLLFLKGNKLSYIPDQVCLHRVEVIALGENAFSEFKTGSFSSRKFPSLVQLSLFAMDRQIKIIEKNAFSSPTLHRLELTFGRIKFSSQGIHSESFADLPRLHTLSLGHNIMDVDEDKFVRLFGNLSSVTFVDMQDCELRHLTPRMLSGFRNLTRLRLNRNLFLSLTDGLFDSLVHLQHLDLCQNQFHVVQPVVFSEVTRDRLRSLDLSGNPFSCSCDLLWFQSWLNSDASLFHKSWTTYECHNKPNVSVQQFFIAPQACIWRQTTYILVDVILSLLILVLTVVFGVIRYRWHIRLLVYETFKGQGEARRRHLQNNHFEHDVFVVYDDYDETWVRQHFIPEMEERLHLRLCLQGRDLDAGRTELDTIAENMEKSKKVLMLFSTNFVQNALCQFQLSMCLQHVIEHDDALIIACLDDVAPRDMTVAMIGVLKTTPYIQWADNADAMASFWGRLRIALREVLHPTSLRLPSPR